jgi:hypothetical protein
MGMDRETAEIVRSLRALAHGAKGWHGEPHQRVHLLTEWRAADLIERLDRELRAAKAQ